MGDSTYLSAYRGAIEAFVEASLRPYIGQLESRQPGDIKAKEFNDPVWGTLGLHPHEVIVLDSPLLQRLQRIRQLGVAHFVYPAARHSRIEHSLGVLHQVDQLVDSVNRNGKSLDDPSDLIPRDIRLTLRLTALCHDVGHGVMSHVIENALFYDDRVENLRREFRVELDRDGPLQLSEMAAYYMIGSPAFAELVGQALRIGRLAGSVIDASAMARAVVGEMMSETHPQLHELITGPFDADKMDYMARDAKMCGVPVVTDFTRLIQKVRAASVHKADLPPEIARNLDGASTAPSVVIGVASSGAATLDEVALGRSLMFDKIYRHHKVRAAEAMVAAICDHGLKYLVNDPALVPLVANDEQLLDIDSAWLEARAVKQSPGRARDFRVASDVASRLRSRQLFVRAFAFASVLPDDGYRGAEEQRVAFDDLVRATGDAEQRPIVIERIAEEVMAIATAVGKEDLLVPYEDLTAYISVDPPANKTIDRKPDPSRAYLIDNDGRLVAVDRIQADTRAWADAYVNVRDLGYVFCPREISELVHVATEVVFRSVFELRVPRGLHAYSKFDPKAIRSLKLDLLENGYYNDKARDLEPLPARLQRADITKRLDTIRERLSGYAGPVPAEQEHGRVQESKLTNGRMLDWLSQFPDELVECALLTLERIQFLDRGELNRALEGFRRAQPDLQDAVLSTLGEAKDGSSVLTYFAKDHDFVESWEANHIGVAANSGLPIVFIDDLLGTGRSASSILSAWMGAEPEDSLDEVRTPLSVQAAHNLQGLTLHFVFMAELAGEGGRDHLLRTVERLGLNAQIYIHHLGASIATLSELEREHPDLPWSKYRDYSARVGLEVLSDERAKPLGWRDERKLGYGNHEVLVVSAFNTPTATLTSLWKTGTFEGRDWAAVFPRRTKR